MKVFNWLDWLAFTFVIIGALNWGTVGLFQINIVSTLAGGNATIIARAIYTIVGLSGLYCLYSLNKVSMLRTSEKAEEFEMKRAA